MLEIITLLVVGGAAAVLSFRRSRERLLEKMKALSDLLVVWLLRSTSQFGSELTQDGKAEQRLWREQRLRNLKGLAQRSRQRWGEKTK